MKARLTVRLITSVLGICLSLWGCGGGGDGGPPPTPANFSEYYPLTKGTFRTYQITEPGGGTRTLTEAWTSGATYISQASVRTCESPLEWEDQAHVGGQTLSFALSDDAGNVITTNVPVIIGIDNWQPGQTVSTNASIPSGSFTTDVTFIGIESVTVPAGVFPDSMKVNFSINDGAFSGTSWYAKDVGLVKEIDSDGETWELTAYGTLPSPPPTLLSVTPPAGAVDGGNLITLTGDGFQPGANVTIGNKLATSVLVKDPSTITAFIPPGTLGTADVAVVNPDCQVALMEDGLEYRKVWTETSAAGAPEARTGHSAVWTGAEMIVWGGQNGNSIAKNTGARFDPATNTWKQMTTVGAPSSRWGHTAVWTGTEMIIWGGFSGAFSFQTLNDGARYNPQTDI